MPDFTTAQVRGGWKLPTRDQLVNAFNARGARFIGIAVADPSTASTDAAIRNPLSPNSAFGDMAALTDATNSNVPNSAFGGSCLTGINSSAVAADGPGATCRLIFSLARDGAGLNTAVASAVKALAYAIQWDVHIRAVSGNAGVDAVGAFVGRVEPSVDGGWIQRAPRRVSRSPCRRSPTATQVQARPEIIAAISRAATHVAWATSAFSGTQVHSSHLQGM